MIVVIKGCKGIAIFIRSGRVLPPNQPSSHSCSGSPLQTPADAAGLKRYSSIRRGGQERQSQDRSRQRHQFLTIGSCYESIVVAGQREESHKGFQFPL